MGYLMFFFSDLFRWGSFVSSTASACIPFPSSRRRERWIPMDPFGIPAKRFTWPFSQLRRYSIDYIPTDLSIYLYIYISIYIYIYLYVYISMYIYIYIYIDGWFYTPHVGQTKYMAIVEVWHRKTPALFGCAARFRQRKKIPCCLRCLMSYSAASCWRFNRKVISCIPMLVMQ